MSFENLLFILALVAIAFVNVVLPWLRRQAEQARRGQPEPAGEEPVDVPEATARRPRPAPAALPDVQTAGPRRASTPAAAHGLRAADRRALHAPVASLAEARRGIVLRTILGPCRAQEPFDGTVN